MRNRTPRELVMVLEAMASKPGLDSKVHVLLITSAGQLGQLMRRIEQQGTWLETARDDYARALATDHNGLSAGRRLIDIGSELLAYSSELVTRVEAVESALWTLGLELEERPKAA